MESNKKRNGVAIFLQEVVQGIQGAGVGIVFILLCFLILNYFNIVQLSVFIPALSVLPHRTNAVKQNQKDTNGLPNSVVPLAIPDFSEKCPVTQQGNPLVKVVIQSGDGQAGSVWGHIDQLSYNSTTKTADFDVIAVHGDQHHSFHLIEKAGLVYNNTTKTQLTLADVRSGQAVELSFQCDSYTNHKFTITQVAILNQ